MRVANSKAVSVAQASKTGHNTNKSTSSHLINRHIHYFKSPEVCSSGQYRHKYFIDCLVPTVKLEATVTTDGVGRGILGWRKTTHSLEGENPD